MVRTDHKELKQQNALAVSAIQAQKAEHWRKEIDDSHRAHDFDVSCNKRGIITVLVPEMGLIIEGRVNLGCFGEQVGQAKPGCLGSWASGKKL